MRLIKIQCSLATSPFKYYGFTTSRVFCDIYLVFTTSRHPSNVSMAKYTGSSLDPDFGLLASSARTRPIQRGAPGGNVVRIELEIDVVSALQVDAMRD